MYTASLLGHECSTWLVLDTRVLSGACCKGLSHTSGNQHATPHHVTLHYIHAYKHACMHTYICIYIYIYIYNIHIYIYILT